MSAIATPAIPHPFGNGSRLWLISIAIWLAVLGGQIALSGTANNVCHGTTEALRQLLSFPV